MASRVGSRDRSAISILQRAPVSIDHVRPLSIGIRTAGISGHDPYVVMFVVGIDIGYASTFPRQDHLPVPGNAQRPLQPATARQFPATTRRRSRSNGRGQQAAEGPVDAESQSIVAGETGIDPALGDGLLRGGEARVVRITERQAMTVEIEGDEAEPGLLRRPLGMTKGLVNQARVAPAPPGRTSAGGANAPHFL